MPTIGMPLHKILFATNSFSTKINFPSNKPKSQEKKRCKKFQKIKKSSKKRINNRRVLVFCVLLIYKHHHRHEKWVMGKTHKTRNHKHCDLCFSFLGSSEVPLTTFMQDYLRTHNCEGIKLVKIILMYFLVLFIPE